MRFETERSEVKNKLESQGYRIVGNHSAVKICEWTKKSLKNSGVCFKENFYSISSHRCLQMTPALICNQRCKHCWRDISYFNTKWEGSVDEPVEIIEGCLKAQSKLLSGFGGNKKVPELKFKEALTPNQAAISLTGEPTMYPKLPELIKEFHKRNFTTFLVTNGTFPKRIEKLKQLPTNLYISVEAPNKALYNKLCNPVTQNSWKRLQETLKLIKNLSTRTVLRITCMKGFNMDMVKEFAELAEKSKFDYIEAKGYMHIGHSRERMPRSAMPSHEEIRKFSEKLEANTSYSIEDEKKDSRVVKLAKI